MFKKTYSNLDIADNSEDTNSVIATHEDTNFANGENNNITIEENNSIAVEEDNSFVIDEDNSFAFDSEDINFTFDNSEDVSFITDNNKDISVDNDSMNPTVDSKKKNDHDEVVAVVCNICKQKWKPGNTTGTFTIHLNNKHKRNISLKQQTLLCFAAMPYISKDAKRINEINKKEFKITRNIFRLTTDNDANMIVAERELQVALLSLGNNEYMHYRCVAHILNIAVKHGMQLKTIIIEKIRNFIKKNNTFLMLQKFDKMKETLDYLVAKNKRQLEDLWLNEDEWKQMDAIDVRLVFTGLKRHLDQYLSSYEEDECYMAQSIMHKLEKYWNIIEQSTILHTLLDSHSKLITFVTCETRSTAISMLYECMLDYQEAPSNPLNTSTTRQKKDQEKQNQCLFFKSLLQQENAAQMENELE
ncbi:12482_t:CDS:2 [Cetraspora pellucida]|uniref:12482_t:CDS:1 n=1 Tax=Cetraspora pellucida TaxID=1433469 RepID=A0ACA9KTT3_9GLOM|nr:12482_t:CDS:2 [Cetraspora pellucida]